MEILADLTDEEVAKRSSRERFLFSIIVTRYQEKLSRYIRRLGVFQKEEIEDILQDVFIKVYKNLQEFDASLSFSSWVYRITHNETMTFFRKKSLRPYGHYVEDSEKVFSSLGSEINIEKELDTKINSEKLAAILPKISKKYRDAIILRYFEEKTYQEISDILRIPTGSVATLIHRAKKALQKKLKHLDK